MRALVIDELHNLLAGRSDTRREFLNVLRYLGNQLRIPLVGVGTQEAHLAIRSDEQLENRFEPFTLPSWQPDDAARSLLASFAASYPLHRPSRLDTSQMAEYLLARSEGTIGELAALLTAAADAAITTSGIEQITDTTLAMADYRLFRFEGVAPGASRPV
ncbi:MAG TPA: TniB family NTP-binding protein [Micropruina sp.]|nr:TniB family NTP-binding protein [Micropruina sp.]